MTEAWHNAKRFGFTSPGSGEVNWFAVARNDAAVTPANLAQSFYEFAPLVGDLIRSTPVDQIFEDDLGDLSGLRDGHRGPVCLMGDAAHATTPNLGQGAAQTTEDARVLAACLADDRATAFQNFQNIRRRKVSRVVNTSWRIGKLAHLPGRFVAALRNIAIRLAPKGPSRSLYDDLFSLESL